MSNTGLGRGLDSLLPEDGPKKGNLKNIPVDKIEPNPHQPRQEFDPDKMEELTRSIQQQGVIEPVVLQPAENQTHTLIAGERRWRAACQAELDSIPAIVRDVSAEQSLSVALIENIQREDLNPIEEARAYKKLKINQDLSQAEVAELVGKNRPTVANRLRLLQLPEAAKEALVDEKITAGHARALLALEEDEKIVAVLEKIISKELNVRQTEKLIQAEKSGDKTKEETGSDKKEKKPPTHFEHLVSELENSIGAPVAIETDNERKAGHVKIFFNNPDEFDMIRERLKKIELD